jgi:hypothetical protein
MLLCGFGLAASIIAVADLQLPALPVALVCGAVFATLMHYADRSQELRRQRLGVPRRLRSPAVANSC